MSYQTVTTQPQMYPPAQPQMYQGPPQTMPYGGGYPQGQTYQGGQMVPNPNQYQNVTQGSKEEKGSSGTSCLAWCCCIYCCIKICCSSGDDGEMDDAECCSI